MEERFETFTVLIARISRSIKRIKADEMADFELKGPHVSCLYYLSQQDGMTAAELCERCDEDKAAISRSLDDLEKNGYIKNSDNGAYAGSKPKGKVVVAGSSSVSPVMEKLKEAYTAVNPDAEIEIQTSDSTTGVESAISGICDIGMELKDTETSQGVKATAIALDGIAVVVNKANTVDNISTDTVKGIYTGDITSWADVK